MKTLTQHLVTKIKHFTSLEKRKIVANIGWLASERLFRMGVGFFTLAWTARFLGVEQFGNLNFAIAFVGLFSPLLQLASDQIIFRDLVNSPQTKESILGSALLVKFGSGLLVFILASASAFVLKGEGALTLPLVVILSTASLVNSFNIVDLWFQSQVAAKNAVIAKNCAFFAATGLRILALELGASIEYFAWLLVLESLFNIIGLLVVFRLTGNDVFRWRFDWVFSKRLMKVSFPLIFSTLAIVVYMKIDQVMLWQMASAEAVGVYSAAVRLSEIWPFASTMLVRSLAPSIIAAKKISNDSYYAKLQKLCNLQATLVYAIALPMTFLSTPFVILVFGSDYRAAGPVLAIHIWSSMFLFLGYVKEIWITTEERTWFSFSFTVSGAIMNVILNFIFIPQYAEIGAAVATIISYAFADYVMCFMYPPARKFGVIMTKAMTFNLIKAS
jgi:PST family polysaccharide transporter